MRPPRTPNTKSGAIDAACVSLRQRSGATVVNRRGASRVYRRATPATVVDLRGLLRDPSPSDGHCCRDHDDLHPSHLVRLRGLLREPRAAIRVSVTQRVFAGRAADGRYEPARAFYPWIATIAARLALNWRRSRARLVFQEPNASWSDMASALDALGESIVEEGARALWKAVNTLSSGERTAVLLFYKQDLSIADVAQVLTCRSRPEEREHEQRCPDNLDQ